MRKAFAKIVIGLARKDPKLVVLIGDISHYLFKDFEKEFPDRFYNIGICEQTMVSVAAGLAINGMRPIIHTIAPFCVERAYEQIKIDLCYQDLDVTMVSVGGSFDYAHLGCTHHCYEDVSILRPLPNMDIYVPGTNREFSNLLVQSWYNGRPKYFKLNKTQHSQDTKVIPEEVVVFNKGRATNPILFVNGHLLDTVADLEDHTIIYSPTIEPLSLNSQLAISQLLHIHQDAIVIEENSKIGAFADKISDISSECGAKVAIKKVGIPRKFCLNYGSASDQRKELGLTKEAILEAIGV